MKEIKIFIASSLEQFVRERKYIQHFITNLNADAAKVGLRLVPLLCENFDDHYVQGRTQEQYNGFIRNSDICLFVFYTRVGSYTLEEFQTATAQQKMTGRPKTLVCLKACQPQEAEPSLLQFQKELTDIYQHPFQTFSQLDTVFLLLLLQLSQLAPALQIQLTPSVVTLNGVPVLQTDKIDQQEKIWEAYAPGHTDKAPTCFL